MFPLSPRASAGGDSSGKSSAFRSQATQVGTLVRSGQLDDARALLESMLKAHQASGRTASTPGELERSRSMQGAGTGGASVTTPARGGRRSASASSAQQLLFSPSGSSHAQTERVEAPLSTSVQRNQPTEEVRTAEDLAAELWIRRTLADVLLRARDPLSAAPQLVWLLEHAPEDPRVLFMAGERHRQEGHPEHALPLLLAALEHQDAPFVRLRIADVLMQLDRLGEAEAMLDGALLQAPEDPHLLRRRARVLAQTGRADQAAQIFTQLANKGADQAPQDYVASLRLKLEALPLAERLNEVRRLLTVPSRRENPWLLSLAGELALECGALDEARTSLDSARALAPDDPFFLKRLGFAYNRLKCYPRVVETLGAAFLHDPRELVVQQVLLAAARKAGKLGELQTLLGLAYERHPGFHKLSGLLKKVEHQRALEAAAPPETAQASASPENGTRKRRGKSS